MALHNLRYRASLMKTLGLRTRGPPYPDAWKGPELRAQGGHDQVSIILVRLSSRASPRPVEANASGRHLPAWRRLPYDARVTAGSRGGKSGVEHQRTLGCLPAQQSTTGSSTGPCSRPRRWRPTRSAPVPCDPWHMQAAGRRSQRPSTSRISRGSTSSLHRYGPCLHRSNPWSWNSIERSWRCRVTVSHLVTIPLKSKQPSARR